MFNWLNAGEAKKFGKSLAQYFIDHVPSSERTGDKKFALKTKKTLDAMARQAAEFKQSHKLNVYKRAQLLNQFKWALKDAGLADDYINQLALWLNGIL